MGRYGSWMEVVRERFWFGMDSNVVMVAAFAGGRWEGPSVDADQMERFEMGGLEDWAKREGAVGTWPPRTRCRRSLALRDASGEAMGD